MAYGLNKVQLIGRLGSDPELRYTDSQVAHTRLRIATNESYKDQSGNMVERTEWHTVVAWRRPAEILSEYLKKGSQVYIEGKLQTREWEDKDGNKRYSTEVVVNDWVFLDRKEGGQGGGFSGGRGPGGGGPDPEPPFNADSGAAGGKDDDLPF